MAAGIKPLAVVQGALAAYATLTGGAALAGIVGGRTAGFLALTAGAFQSGWTAYTLAAIQEQRPRSTG